MSRATTPEQLHSELARTYNDRDMDSLVNLYDDNSILIPQPGMIAKEKSEIRNALSEFLKLEGKMQVKSTYVYELNGVAFTRSEWQISKGDEILVQGAGIEVMKKSADGRWRFQFDHPFGANS